MVDVFSLGMFSVILFEEGNENLAFAGGTRIQRVLFTALGTDLEWLLGKEGQSTQESSTFLAVVSRNGGKSLFGG